MLRAQEDTGTATFRTGVSDVRVDAQVLDGKRIITNLTKEDFVVTDENQTPTIAYFGRESEPLSLLILLDISGSMTRYIDQISNTARQALSVLSPGDRVAIMVFGKKSEIHQDFSDNLAETARQLATVVSDHDVGAGTALNAAVMSAADYIGSHVPPGPGRRAILVLTDNLSLSYLVSDKQVIKQLYAADAVCNAIVVGRGIRPAPPKPGVYQNPDFTPADVFHLAEETGGEAVHANRADVTFRDMVERIRTRYSLAYHAPDAPPNSFRHIRVALSPLASRRYPTAEVHARTGYYVRP